MNISILKNMKSIKNNKLSRIQQNNFVRNSTFTELMKATSNKVQKSNKTDKYSQRNILNDTYPVYDKKGFYASNISRASSMNFSIDKGTAAHTTVYVNRNSYDQILNATTYGDVKWDEMGVDDEKRWVVVNGQRFECEHSPEEKAIRKRAKMTFVDYIIEEDRRKIEDRIKNNGVDKPKGNIKALSKNTKVMQMLGNIFNANTPEKILSKLA